MPMTATATAPLSRSRLVACATALRRFPLSVLQLLFRLAIAGVFLRAGLNKLASWELTVQLFRDEYKVPVFPAEVAATMATFFEIGCSALLIAGLATRVATAAPPRDARRHPALRVPERVVGAPRVGIDPALSPDPRRGYLLPRPCHRPRTPRRPASAEGATAPLRPWQRLGLRLAALFAAVTVLAVGVVGTWIYDRQRREVEETVGIQLLNIARVGALLVDPGPGHGGAPRAGRRRAGPSGPSAGGDAAGSPPDHARPAPDRLRRRAAPGAGRGQQRGRGASRASRIAWRPRSGEILRLDGRGRRGARHAHLPQRAGHVDHRVRAGAPAGWHVGRARWSMDYPVEIYLDRLQELRRAVVQGALAGGLMSLARRPPVRAAPHASARRPHPGRGARGRR